MNKGGGTILIDEAFNPEIEKSGFVRYEFSLNKFIFIFIP